MTYFKTIRVVLYVFYDYFSYESNDFLFSPGRRFVKKNIIIKKSSKTQPPQPSENADTSLSQEDPSSDPSVISPTTLQIKTEPEENSMWHSLKIYFACSKVHFSSDLFILSFH